tara:strand:+ start:220 stop:1185 length:966 start_codon:yes stop_codon:yes gene_type:complete
MRNSTELNYLTKEEYINAYKDLENFCKDKTELLLFGEFGDASFPSISDLDVFICLKDDNFELQRKNIITFINEDEIRKYLFFHDPLILSESLLPYFKTFHTAYNLTFTFHENNIVIPNPKLGQLQLLNQIWTTYLMAICPGLLNNLKLGIRDKLLVLKNICQSITNIDNTSNALVRSDEIRHLVYQNKINMKDVNTEFESLLRQLYEKANKIHFEENQQTSTKEKIKVEINKTFRKKKNNNFLTELNQNYIELNSNMFNLFLQFYNKKSDNKLIQNYINESITANDLCKQMNTPYPFIVPFGFQFYRTDIKFAIKKKLLSL